MWVAPPRGLVAQHFVPLVIHVSPLGRAVSNLSGKEAPIQPRIILQTNTISSLQELGNGYTGQQQWPEHQWHPLHTNCDSWRLSTGGGNRETIFFETLNLWLAIWGISEDTLWWPLLLASRYLANFRPTCSWNNLLHPFHFTKLYAVFLTLNISHLSYPAENPLYPSESGKISHVLSEVQSISLIFT